MRRADRDPIPADTSSRARRAAGPLVAITWFVVLALSSAGVGAVGLGQVAQQSALGQSLRVVVPLALNENDDIAAECFKLATADKDVDGIPQVSYGRVHLERTGSGARLVITGNRPVSDPVLRLTIQAGCTTPIRREFVLFMDLPPIDAPAVAMGDAIGREVVPQAAPLRAAAHERPAAERNPATPTAKRPPATRAAQSSGRKDASGGARDVARAGAADVKEARKPAPAYARVAARPAPPPKTTGAAGTQPRLRLSSASLPALSGENAGGAGAARRAQSQQELANALEAETVVLRQRIVELTVMVERLQKELQAGDGPASAPSTATGGPSVVGVANAAPPPPVPSAVATARAAPSAAPAAEASAAPSDAQVAPPAPAPAAPRSATPAPHESWWELNWPWLAALLALPLGIATALLWKRQRNASRIDTFTSRPATTRPQNAVATMRVPGPALRNPPAGVAVAAAELEIPPPPPKKAPAAPIAKDTSKALAVSELLHVTDESRVYVALGHPERAIQVLTQHIKQVSRPMPAAWLMLLELYHTTGQRQEFRRVADEFHVQCNVQSPLWENFGVADVDDGGIETFPHVLRRIIELWRKPDCREYLERLLHDNREGRRTGFPLAAYSDILMLLQVLDAPSEVDIDSDLPDPAALKAGAARGAAPAARGAVAPRGAAEDAGEATTIMRMGQQPLEFELDLDEATRPRGVVEKTTRRGKKE